MSWNRNNCAAEECVGADHVEAVWINVWSPAIIDFLAY